MENTSLDNNSKTKNDNFKTQFVAYNVQNRILERDGLQVQFFDRIKQTTDSFLQTIDIVDQKSKKPIYGLYVEIYNPKDPHNLVFREVETVEKNGQKEIVSNKLQYINQGNESFPFLTNYAQIYQKAFANYKSIQQNKEKPYPTFAEQVKKNTDPIKLLSNYLKEDNNNFNELV